MKVILSSEKKALKLSHIRKDKDMLLERECETIEDIMKANPLDITVHNEITGQDLFWEENVWVVVQRNSCASPDYRSTSLKDAFKEFLFI